MSKAACGEGASPNADAPSADERARVNAKAASLSAALLARKGGAEPSLKRFARARGDKPFNGAPAGAAQACATKDEARPAERREKRASLTLRLPIPDFLRLKLAAGLFERTSQSILIEALRTYLDGAGVQKFDECPCLQKAAAQEAAILPASRSERG